MTITKEQQIPSKWSSSDCLGRLSESTNASILLQNACQGILKSSIRPVNSSWYPKLQEEFNQLKVVVTQWENDGWSTYKTQILQGVLSFGQSFSSQKSEMDRLLSSKNTADWLSAANIFLSLSDQLEALKNATVAYREHLSAFERNMSAVHEQMSKTLAGIQAQERDLAVQIQQTNQNLKNLASEIKRDRDVIAKAKREQPGKTVLSIFTTIVTFGLSDLLGGIGVSSIAEGERKIASMENRVLQVQQKMAQDCANLTNEQQTIVSLHALSTSSNMVVEDMNRAEAALDSLKVTWDLLGEELTDIKEKLEKSTEASFAALCLAWYHASLNEWDILLNQTKNLVSSLK